VVDLEMITIGAALAIVMVVRLVEVTLVSDELSGGGPIEVGPKVVSLEVMSFVVVQLQVGVTDGGDELGEATMTGLKVMNLVLVDVVVGFTKSSTMKDDGFMRFC